MADKIPSPPEPTVVKRGRNRSVHTSRPENKAAHAAPATPAPPPATTGYTRNATISLKLGEDLKERLDAALDNIGGRIGERTIAHMVRTAVNDYVTTLENQYNDGDPFPTRR